MSTYLLAIIVSPLKRRETIDKKYGIWSQKSQYDQSEFAFNFGLRLLDYFKDYTEIDYFSETNGIEKLDMAALPKAGGMENWGLIFYQDSSILYDNDITTQIAKQRMITLITHEVAHQWFGNLVTCESFKYYWLNEAFATYLQYVVAEDLEGKNYRFIDRFPLEVTQSSFEIDSTDSTFSMSDDNSPSMIIYKKGAAVLRMIEHYMGTFFFQHAIRRFLKNNAFKSVNPETLFKLYDEEFNERDLKIIQQYFQPWTTQPGHPVIHVSLIDNDTVHVTQKRFFLDEPVDPAEKSYRWFIPLNFIKSNDKSASKFHVFKPSDVNFTIKTDVDDWIIFNDNQIGYYRVNYDQELWKRIRDALYKENYDGINEINRGQLINDVLNFARSEMMDLDYKIALDIFGYLENETGYIPWTAALKHIRFFLLNKMSSNSKNLSIFYVRNLLFYLFF